MTPNHEGLRRYVVSLGQLTRMFRRPTNADRPVTDTGEPTPGPINDAELEAEVADLEAELEK